MLFSKMSFFFPVRFSVSLLLFLGIGCSVWAQTNPATSSPTTLDQLLKTQSPSERGSSVVARYFYPANPDLPLEGPVDESEFICGPNDLFTISIGGPAPQQQLIPVTADGNLLIPGIDPIRVAGKTLLMVKREAEASLRRIIGNHPIEIALSQPRSFLIPVIGGTPAPGMQVISPVLATTRVASVVSKAINGENELQKKLNYGFRPSIRTIEVRRKNGTILYPDLARFFATGNFNYNPLLQEGDLIFIPSFDFVNEVINVQGFVPYPGTYPIRPDDTLLDLLTIACGSNGLGKLTEVRLTRFGENSLAEHQVFNVPDLIARKVANPSLKPRDLIYIPHRNRDNGSVFVDGEVKYPGPYPMSNERTTLRDLIANAGGIREGAYGKSAYVERVRNASESNSPFVIPNYMNPLTRENIALTGERGRLADLDYSSRVFLERELMINHTRIAINLEEALKPDAPDVYLFDGDRLFVARDQRKVLVVGEVVHRGLVDWQPQQGVDAYLAAAGGRGPQATFVYVIKAGTGQLVDGYKSQIESGDIVFVNRKSAVVDTPDLQALQFQRKSSQLQRIATLVTAVSTAVSITATIIYLTRNN
ncbi:MAG TPA: SLBB domain-containing protein [Rhodothermales bacterium]|nr:SLBB domain-containing protein [Rhodothermales bacterium]